MWLFINYSPCFQITLHKNTYILLLIWTVIWTWNFILKEWISILSYFCFISILFLSILINKFFFINLVFEFAQIFMAKGSPYKIKKVAIEFPFSVKFCNFLNFLMSIKDLGKLKTKLKKNFMNGIFLGFSCSVRIFWTYTYSGVGIAFKIIFQQEIYIVEFFIPLL